MIGLSRHAVKVVKHEVEWTSLAYAACQDVQVASGDLIVEVQHVGSTAVRGLAAKPILDIAAGLVSEGAVPDLIGRLTEIGYIYLGDNGDEGGHLFVKESAPDIRTIHLHLVLHNGNQWNDYLSFRNLLRGDVVTRNQYADLKLELVRKFEQDRVMYTESKRAFITGALGRVTAGRNSAQPAIPVDRGERRRSR